MMNEQQKHKFTAKIADVEPFVFAVSLEEEPIFRKAVFHVNEQWRKMRENQPDKSSHYIMAKVALAFAELYYRKQEQLAAQSQLLNDFESKLDEILLATE